MPALTDLIGPAGPLEALLDEPAGGSAGAVRAAVVFAHPHPQFGGTMHTKAVYQGAKGLARLGCAVLRFNFRGVGRSAGEFDQGDGEKADFRRRSTTSRPDIRARRSGRPASRSDPGWRSRSARDDPRVAALIGIAPPVATSVSGQAYSFERTLASTKPKFFVQGEADEVCPLEAMWEFYGRLHEPKELVVDRLRESPVRGPGARGRRGARGLAG